MKSLNPAKNQQTSIVQIENELKPYLPASQLTEVIDRCQNQIAKGKFSLEIAKRCVVAGADVKYVAMVNPKTFEDILGKDHPTLGSMNVYLGHVRTIAIMEVCLSWAFELSTSGKKLRGDLISTLCELLYEDYFWLTVPDIKFCIKKGLKGSYGSDYDRLDVPTVFAWFDSYRKERLAASESRNRKQKHEEGDFVPMPDDYKQKIQALEESLRMDRVKKMPKEIVDWDKHQKQTEQVIEKLKS